ncbi:MAG: hypothetical protein Tsb009_35990 [Planctomycetaceae bacterium]
MSFLDNDWINWIKENWIQSIILFVAGCGTAWGVLEVTRLAGIKETLSSRESELETAENDLKDAKSDLTKKQSEIDDLKQKLAAKTGSLASVKKAPLESPPANLPYVIEPVSQKFLNALWLKPHLFKLRLEGGQTPSVLVGMKFQKMKKSYVPFQIVLTPPEKTWIDGCFAFHLTNKDGHSFIREYPVIYEGDSSMPSKTIANTNGLAKDDEVLIVFRLTGKTANVLPSKSELKTKLDVAIKEQ